MKVLVIGGSGLIGNAVVKELKKLKHEIVIASPHSGDVKVDLTDHNSIEQMYKEVPDLDAVISTPASGSKMARIPELSRQDFQDGFQVKCFGQMDLVLTGQKYLRPGGSFTLTTGIMSTDYIPAGSVSAAINNSVEGFVKSASLDLSNNLRLNAVSPNVIIEAMGKLGNFFKGYKGVSVEDAAYAYIRSLEGIINGRVLKVW